VGGHARRHSAGSSFGFAENRSCFVACSLRPNVLFPAQETAKTFGRKAASYNPLMRLSYCPPAPDRTRINCRCAALLSRSARKPHCSAVVYEFLARPWGCLETAAVRVLSSIS